METDQTQSNPMQLVTEILADLKRQSGVDRVALCTIDGLLVNGPAHNSSQISAVACFLVSAANLSSNMLNHTKCNLVTMEFVDDTLLVCQQFSAGSDHLILTAVLDHKMHYESMLAQKVSEIQKSYN
jgi:predicted regulator of Ras-like GTPase activity (Roadblock/LC7/MglB family)